ncbi:DUF443 family protein [Amphibacillus sediminis]|uniref:DUF443 family protein n=1 Tax=Amphibacillus sediminis TaxID=360185 RepID=UPI001FE1AA85|nr:DUF443 family protein [Amphibacillus sediminis]
MQRVAKNPRYRILKIDGETYAIDMGKSVMKSLFPFLTWIVPNTIYKVDEDEINSKLRHVERDKSKDKSLAILGTGIGIFLANLLTPLTDYFNISSTMLVNGIVGIVMLLVVMLFRVYLGNRYKRKFAKMIAFDEALKVQVFIRPESFKHFMQCFLSYCFILIFLLAMFAFFIIHGNIVAIVVATFFFFCLTLLNVMTILDGPTPVRFK